MHRRGLNDCFTSGSTAPGAALKEADGHTPPPSTIGLTQAEAEPEARSPKPGARAGQPGREGPPPLLRPLPILPGYAIAGRDHRFIQPRVSISAPFGDPGQTMAEKTQKRWVCCLRKTCSQLSAKVEPVPGRQRGGLRWCLIPGPRPGWLLKPRPGFR